MENARREVSHYLGQRLDWTAVGEDGHGRYRRKVNADEWEVIENEYPLDPPYGYRYSLHINGTPVIHFDDWPRTWSRGGPLLQRLLRRIGDLLSRPVLWRKPRAAVFHEDIVGCHVTAMVAQFPVTLDISRNLDSVLSILAKAAPQTLIVLPEDSLSGYAEDPSFLNTIDRDLLLTSLQTLRKAATSHDVHLIFGSCLPEDGGWYNAGIYYGPHSEEFVYRKVNLAISERGAFLPGSHLPVFEARINGHQVKLAIQLCREIRFPEQWRHLARNGAQIFAYLTNAVGDATQAPVWRSHLVSRAAENQRFVLCANAAHAAQKCPSLIATPSGQVPWEVSAPTLETGTCTLDLSEVSNWYLSQSRDDLI